MVKGTKYYGGFFWVAAISFAVPLVVAARAFNDLRPTTKPTPTPDASGVDHAVWDYLLKSYVAGGLVDYKGMRKDYLFHEYLRELGGAKIEALSSREDQLALCCNAYNAFVINGVISHKITDSVDGFTVNGKGFFDIPEHIFGGKTLSLNDLEHTIIRPTFKDPRVHVALVCAARSCPGLRSEAYVGAQLESQLNDQSVQFANDQKYVHVDPSSGDLYLSPILSWYGGDWNEKYPTGGYYAWIAERVSDEKTKQSLAAATSGQIATKFFKYDWTLNSQADPTASGASAHKPSGDFGSGSIPDE